jgi:uncharacterized membrane protein
LLPILAYIGRIVDGLLLLSLAIGAFAFIRGFELDRILSTMLHRTIDVELPPVHYVGTVVFYFTGAIFTVAGLVVGVSGVYETAISNNFTGLLALFENIPLLMGAFIARSALFFILGFTFLAGRDFIIVLQKSATDSRTQLLKMAAIACLYPFLYALGTVLQSFQDESIQYLAINSLISLGSFLVFLAAITVGYRILGKRVKGV